jgi:two-component system phosphate regulon response regulator PhoB
VEESEKEMMYSSPGNPMLSIEDESSIPSAIPAAETEHPYILAVDDDRSILSLLMSLLVTEGYSCVGFVASQWVLPFLQEMGKRGERHLPALLLLDLMMPGVSGYDIARWLSEHEPYNHIPILVITADARVHDTSAVPGAQDILLKPFQIDALLILVEHFLAPLLGGS